MTEVFRINKAEDIAEAARIAAAVLKRGELVAVPTETVYGLAANAFDEKAVARIYTVKGRPSYNPIIVHVESLAMARPCCAEWPEQAEKLAAAFWPGPLTIVLPKTDLIPSIVTAGGSTVALRWPSHPFMRALIAACGFPLAAPSANLSNQLSPTTSDHVFHMLRGKIPLIVDAGPANVGIESTVVDLSSDTPRILRAGMISLEQIANVIGTVLPGPAQQPNQDALKSPGMLEKHYAPRARLLVRSWKNDHDLANLVRELPFPLGKMHIIAHEHIPESPKFGRVALIPHDAEAYARAIYAELHLCDELGAELILVEAVPSGDQWAGIRDRLSRASSLD